MRKKIFGMVLMMAVAALLLAACSGSAATPEPVTYTIEMTEYAFTPNTIEAQVGQQVTLELVNSGQLEHEIMFGRDVMMMNNHPSGYQMDMFEQGGVEPEVMQMENMDMSEAEHEEEGHSGFMVLVPEMGGNASMTFTVTKDMVGEWEIGCFELDGVHYTQGMKGTFIVTQ